MGEVEVDKQIDNNRKIEINRKGGRQRKMGGGADSAIPWDRRKKNVAGGQGTQKL